MEWNKKGIKFYLAPKMPEIIIFFIIIHNSFFVLFFKRANFGAIQILWELFF